MDIRGELIAALSHSSLLQELARNCPQTDRFRSMLSSAEVQLYRPGHVIIRQGQSSDRIFFLADGVVKVVKNGKEVCSLSRVGEVFGELATLTGKTRSATVVAETAVTCVTVQPDAAAGLDEHENVSFKNALQNALMNLLVERLQETTSEVAKLRDDFERAQAQIRVLMRGLDAKESEINTLRARLKRSPGWMQRKHEET